VLIQPGMMIYPNNHLNLRCETLPDTDPRKAVCDGDGNEALDDRYHFTNEMSQYAADALLSSLSFERLFGLAPASIQGLAASERSSAYRHDDMFTIAEYPDWDNLLGPVAPPDAYYVYYCSFCSSNLTFDNASNPAQICTRRFIENLAHVQTFITNAYWDMGYGCGNLSASR
jgi:hypothetical protein